MASSARPQLPTFVVLGAMKCGTTSLHGYIGEHPDAFTSTPKELDFFSDETNFARGLDWYRSFFVTNRTVRGESSPNYMKRRLFPDTASRVAEVLPGAKLLCVFRHPVDRLLSHYVHAVAAGRESRTLQHVLSARDANTQALIDPGLYQYQLEPWLERFPREAFWFGLTEDLEQRPGETMESVFRFLALPLERAPRISPLSLNAGSRKLTRRELLQRLDRLPIIGNASRRVPKSLSSIPVRRPHLTVGERDQLFALYEPEIRALAQTIGRPITWA